MKKAILGCVLFGLSSIAQAIPVTVSTGDLGNNVIIDAGSFDVYLDASMPSNSILSTIDIKYGLWNDPVVDIDILFNMTLVGSVQASSGYISPGPQFASFDITGLLLDGINTITFDGNAANTGDFVIGQVDMNYDSRVSVSEPSILALLSLGLLSVGFMRKRIS